MSQGQQENCDPHQELPCQKKRKDWNYSSLILGVMFGMCLPITVVHIVFAMLHYCYHLDEHHNNNSAASPHTSNITSIREQVFWITLICIGAIIMSVPLLLYSFLQSLPVIQLLDQRLETERSKARSSSMSVLANSLTNCLVQFAMSSLYGISLGLTISDLTKGDIYSGATVSQRLVSLVLNLLVLLCCHSILRLLMRM